jgi:peptidoglycan/LPS O-acetylase OafA/YrhL
VTVSGRSDYIPGIDGLRAIAVISVLLYHVDHTWLPGGFSGVDIFFVISGFVVSRATSGIEFGGFFELVKKFYRRRFLRILPAALVFLVVMQLASSLFIPSMQRLGVPDLTALASAGGLANVILWMRAGDYFDGATALNPFTHMWSLAVEEQYYFIFPAFAALIFTQRWRRLALAVLLLAAVISLALAAYFTARDHAFAFYMLPTRFWELAAGMLLFLGLRRLTDVHAPQWVQLAVQCAAVALILSSVVFLGEANFPFPLAIAPVLGSLLTIGAVSLWPSSMLARALSFRPIRYVGSISYSLYLWHWGVIVLMLWTTGLDSLAYKAIAIGVSFGLAALSYRFVEQPFRSSQRWRGARSWVVLAGAVAAIGIATSGVAGLVFFRPLLTQSVIKDTAVWSPYVRVEIDGPCKVSQGSKRFVQGEVISFAADGCEKAAQIFVVGDSHAQAYARTVAEVATLGHDARVYTATGCTVLDPFVTSGVREESGGCTLFIRQSLAEIEASARPGDVLFLPGLRQERFREHWEAGIRPVPTGGNKDEESTNIAAARTLLAAVLEKGVRVVFELPGPVFKISPFRCFDWFNSGNPACVDGPTVAQAELNARRAVAVRQIAALQAADSRVEVWDSTPVLCPDDPCALMRNGKPIVWDTDHLSGYGAQLLAPSFAQLVSPL